MKVDLTLAQAERILKTVEDPEIRAAVINELRIERRRILVKLSKVTLMIDALETGDYSNLSEKLIKEMNEMDGVRPILLLSEKL